MIPLKIRWSSGLRVRSGAPAITLGKSTGYISRSLADLAKRDNNKYIVLGVDSSVKPVSNVYLTFTKSNNAPGAKALCFKKEGGATFSVLGYYSEFPALKSQLNKMKCRNFEAQLLTEPTEEFSGQNVFVVRLK